MRGKLDELRRKRDELVGRAKTGGRAEPGTRLDPQSVDILDPTSEISRFEEKIRREEARIRGHEELAASSLDAQFESLEREAGRRRGRGAAGAAQVGRVGVRLVTGRAQSRSCSASSMARWNVGYA